MMSEPVAMELQAPNKTMGPGGDTIAVNGDINHEAHKNIEAKEQEKEPRPENNHELEIDINEKEIDIQEKEGNPQEKKINPQEKEINPQEKEEPMEAVQEKSQENANLQEKSQEKTIELQVTENLEPVENGEEAMRMDIDESSNIEQSSEVANVQENPVQNTISKNLDNVEDISNDSVASEPKDTELATSVTNPKTFEPEPEIESGNTCLDPLTGLMIPATVSEDNVEDSQTDETEKAVSVTVTPNKDHSKLSNADNNDDSVHVDDFDDLDDEESFSESAFAPKIISESVVSLSNDAMELTVEDSQTTDPKRAERLMSLNDTLSDEGDVEMPLQDVWDDSSPEKSSQKSVNGIAENGTSKTVEKSPEVETEGIVSVNRKLAQKSLETNSQKSLLKESDIKKEKEDCIMIDGATSTAIASSSSSIPSSIPIPPVFNPIQITPVRPRLQNVPNIRIAPQSCSQSPQFMVFPPRMSRPNGNVNSVLMPSSLFHPPPPPYHSSVPRPPVLIPNASMRGATNRGQFPSHQQPHINIFAPRTIGTSSQFTVIRNTSPRIACAPPPGSLLQGGVPIPANVQAAPPFAVLPSNFSGRIPVSQAPRSMVRIVQPGTQAPKSGSNTLNSSASTLIVNSPQLIASSQGGPKNKTMMTITSSIPGPLSSNNLVVNSSANIVVTSPQHIATAPVTQPTATLTLANKTGPRILRKNKQVNIQPAEASTNKVMVNRNARGGVKQYMPPNPPADLKMPEKWRLNHTFLCRECGDVFLFRSSLRLHLERRSMLVNYFCSPCGKKLAFVNKCAMMNHRILHKGEVSNSRTESAIVTVLPPHMMPPLPENAKQKKIEEKKKTEENEEQKKNESAGKQSTEKSETTANNEEKRKEKTSSSVHSTPEVNDSDPLPGSLSSRQELQTLLESRPDIVRRELALDWIMECTECGRNIGNTLLARQQHFRKRHKNWQKRYKCDRCLQMLPNPCAFAAHLRIHDKTAPYVCPVCGECMEGDRNHFLRHVKLKCMHFYQKLTTPCPFCQKKVTDDGTMLMLGPVLNDHVKNMHIDGYFKCTKCPLAYRTMQGLEKHCDDMHEGAEMTSKQIFRCPCCNQITHSYDAVLKHVVEKLPEIVDESKIKSLLQCPYCDTFAGGGVFRRHLLMRHGVHAVDEICSICGVESRLLRDHLIHRVMMHTDLPQRAIKSKPESDTPEKNKRESSGTVSTLTSPLTKPSTSETIKAEKMLKRMSSSESLDVVEARKRRYSETSEASSYASEKQKPLKRMCFPVVGKDKSVENFEGQVPTAPPPKARYPCSECDKKFVEKMAAQLHMQEAHGITPTFACHLCANTYTSKPQLDAHIKSFHEGRSQTLPFMCFICEEKHIVQGYKKRVLLEKHLLAVHKIHKNQIDYSRLLPNTDSTQIVVPDSPVKKLRAGEGSFSCAKCDFTCDEREKFQEHILKHRNPESSSPQCQECGLSFTVLPALKRHVFIVHKIRDFEKYMQTSGMKLEEIGSPSKSIDPDSGLTPTNPTTCRVSKHLSREEKEERRRERLSNQRMEVGSSLDTLTCNVCYRDFADDTTLKKHLRVHGMAFIKSKRSRINQWYDDD